MRKGKKKTAAVIDLMEPLLSVIIPVYNAEKRLRISIESVLGSSYRNLELILVNDGSTDSSPDICLEYSASDSRVFTLNQNNCGVSAARNSGISKAKGDFITFVDADDTIENDAYAKVIANQSINTSDMIIFGMSFDYYRMDKYSHSKELSINENLIITKRNIKDYFFYLYEYNYLSSVCNKIMKTALLKDNGVLFNKEMVILEDFKFVLDLLERSNTIMAMSDVLYHYYNNLAGFSFSKRPDIDYKNNFIILDKKLKHFADITGLNSADDIGKVNALIFRYYLIAIEKLFYSDASYIKKYQELQKYIADKEVVKSVALARCSGKRLSIVHWMFKKKYTVILFLAFWFNNLAKRSYRNY